MAHNLNIHNGRASMMYVGEPAWHKLGTSLPKLATSEEAIQAAQLDYQVQKKPIQAILNGKSRVPIHDHFATASGMLGQSGRTALRSLKLVSCILRPPKFTLALESQILTISFRTGCRLCPQLAGRCGR